MFIVCVCVCVCVCDAGSESFTYTITERKMVNGEKVECVRPLSNAEYEVTMHILLLLYTVSAISPLSLPPSIHFRLYLVISTHTITQWRKQEDVSYGTDSTFSWIFSKPVLKGMCGIDTCTLNSRIAAHMYLLLQWIVYTCV